MDDMYDKACEAKFIKINEGLRTILGSKTHYTFSTVQIEKIAKTIFEAGFIGGYEAGIRYCVRQKNDME